MYKDDGNVHGVERRQRQMCFRDSFGTFPKVGDSFRYENLTVTVLAMDGRRVERVLVQPDPDADKDA